MGRENTAALSRKWEAEVLAFSLTIQGIRGRTTPCQRARQASAALHRTLHTTTPTSKMRPPRLQRGTICLLPQAALGWNLGHFHGSRQHRLLGPQSEETSGLVLQSTSLPAGSSPGCENSGAPPFLPRLLFQAGPSGVHICCSWVPSSRPSVGTQASSPPSDIHQCLL